MKGVFGIFRQIDSLIRDVGIERRTAFIGGFAHTGGIINAIKSRNGIYAAGTVGNRDLCAAFLKIGSAGADKCRMCRDSGFRFAFCHKIGLQDHLFAAESTLFNGIIGKKRV